MEHFEDITLDTAYHKPTKWLRYVNNTFVVWSHGPARLQQSVRPTINFKIGVEANDTLLFLDVLVIKRGPKFSKKVYQKPTNIGCYLHFKSNHPYHVKRLHACCFNICFMFWCNHVINWAQWMFFGMFYI
jgi:hypothetical protein